MFGLNKPLLLPHQLPVLALVLTEVHLLTEEEEEEEEAQWRTDRSSINIMNKLIYTMHLIEHMNLVKVTEDVFRHMTQERHRVQREAESLISTHFIKFFSFELGFSKSLLCSFQLRTSDKSEITELSAPAEEEERGSRSTE